MPRYAIKVQYDGTNYVGYQVQPNGRSIQEEIEKALGKMAKLSNTESILTVGSGRTDSGVHALGQVIHFDYPSEIPAFNLKMAMNSILDDAIRVVDAVQVPSDFHARYHAIAKEYLYRVDIQRFPDPFKRHYTTHHPYRFELDSIQSALSDLIGEHDFTSFCSTKTDKQDKIREIYEATAWIDEQQQELVFRIYGNGFLYNMIRIIVGTALQIGNGLRPQQDMQRLLKVKDRQQAGPTAPPQGLYLHRVEYEQQLFES